LTRPQLKSLGELKGKRVGVELRASGEYVLARALRSAGLGLKDVTIVPLNSAEAEAAYEQGELDAVVTRDPWRLRLEEKGARVVFDSRRLETPLYRVLVVREDLLKENQKELKRLLQAHFAALPNLLSNGGMSRGMDAVLRREGLTQPQFEESLKRIVFFNRDENERLLGKGPDSLEPVVKEMARTMKEEGLLAEGEATGNLLDASVVKGVR
jgi:NitT/TauT family transport system substrate-binding protein